PSPPKYTLLPYTTLFRSIKIDPGTQGGKMLRLKGKGVPEINGYGKGDLLVDVNIYTPANLSAEEKKLMEELKTAKNFQPNLNKKDRKSTRLNPVTIRSRM